MAASFFLEARRFFGAPRRPYNPQPMNSRIFVLALLAVIGALAMGGAGAQGFSSISSQPAPAAPAAPAAPVPAVTTLPEATPAAQVPAAVPAFSSVSSVPAPPAEALAAVADVPELTPTTTATPAPALAFSSVSSIAGSGGATGSGPSLPAGRFAMADRILIEKGARRLYLLSRGQVIGEYPVKLGLSPKGHKQFEGDFRTPEGVYYLSRRNPRSEFFLSIEVSYPNEADRARAKQEGMRPGGLIMIHGQPNVPRRPADYYARSDWTDGCIAVSNSDMVEIWQRTRIGIPIEIRP